MRAHVEERHDRLDLLVNNAGAAWRATFADGGWENVRRHMEVNFDAVVRLTEALLPLLRRSAPSAIVNVSSTAGRVARPGSGAYSASKFALAGWSDALAGEEAPNGVHVGLVLPGFITTEGFPQAELNDNPLTRRLVSTPERGAQAIIDAGLGGKAERYVPRPYALAARRARARAARSSAAPPAARRRATRAAHRRRREVSALARTALARGGTMPHDGALRRRLRGGLGRRVAAAAAGPAPRAPRLHRRRRLRRR